MEEVRLLNFSGLRTVLGYPTVYCMALYILPPLTSFARFDSRANGRKKRDNGTNFANIGNSAILGRIA